MPQSAKRGLWVGRMVWHIKSFNTCNLSQQPKIPDFLHDLICGSTTDYQIFKTADGAIKIIAHDEHYTVIF